MVNSDRVFVPSKDNNIKQAAFNELVGALQTGTSFEKMSTDAADCAYQTGVAPHLLHASDKYKPHQESELKQFDELKRRCDCQLRALKDFSSAAKELSLEFVVLNGIPLSQKLYGEPWVRASGSVDIAVLQEDEAKAHAVALEAGFVQAAGFQTKKLTAEGTLDNVILQEIPGPYPISTSDETAFSSTYLRVVEGRGAVVLNIHNSCKGLPQKLMELLVVAGGYETIDNVKLPIPAPAIGFIVLCLCAHEQCEGLKANIQPGILGLDCLIDIHKWLELGAPLRDASNIAFDYKLVRPLGEVFFDLTQVFSDSWGKLDPFFPLYESPWGITYAKRLSSFPERQNNTKAVLKKAALAYAATKEANEFSWGETGAYMPLIRGKLSGTEQARRIEWLIDEDTLGRALENLAFNVVLIDNGDAKKGQLEGDAYLLYKDVQKGWRLKHRAIDADNLDIHTSKHDGKDTSQLLEIIQRPELTRIVIELPASKYGAPFKPTAFLSVKRREYKDIYQPFAGTSPSQTLMKIINGGLLLKEEGPKDPEHEPIRQTEEP